METCSVLKGVLVHDGGRRTVTDSRRNGRNHGVDRIVGCVQACYARGARSRPWRGV